MHFRSHDGAVSTPLTETYTFTAVNERCELSAGPDLPRLRLLQHGQNHAFTIEGKRLHECCIARSSRAVTNLPANYGRPAIFAWIFRTIIPPRWWHRPNPGTRFKHCLPNRRFRQNTIGAVELLESAGSAAHCEIGPSWYWLPINS